MAFRGGRGGRGGGRFGRGGRGGFGSFGFDHPAKHAPHENFPEITLPEMTCAKATNEEKALILSTLKFEEFLRHSCYHLEEDAPKKKNEDKEIGRFSDRKHKTQTKREALASYLKLTPANFPAELLHGSRRGQLSNKKLRWDRDSDEHAFDVFEKLEQNHKDGEKKTEKDGDDEDDQEEEEVEEDESSDDDYNQILSLMTTMMTGTKRQKHMKTTMIDDHWPLKRLTPSTLMFSFLGILRLQLIE